MEGHAAGDRCVGTGGDSNEAASSQSGYVPVPRSPAHTRMAVWRRGSAWASSSLLVIMVIAPSARSRCAVDDEGLGVCCAGAPRGGRALHERTGAPGSPLPAVPSAIAGASGAPGRRRRHHHLLRRLRERRATVLDRPAATPPGPSHVPGGRRRALGLLRREIRTALPGPYVNNMDAWRSRGPFNLSTLTLGELRFQPLLRYGDGQGLRQGMVSINGQQLLRLDIHGLPGLDRRQHRPDQCRTRSATCAGSSQVWIAFIFQSDSSIVNEGAYVDEVLDQRHQRWRRPRHSAWH